MSVARSACLAAALLPLVAAASPSDLDLPFGDGGFRHYDYVSTDPYRPLPIGPITGTPDGGFLALTEQLVPPGQVNKFLSRYDARGDLVASVDLGVRASELGAARFAPDGKLLLAVLGFVGDEFGMIVQRRLASGALDPGFSGDGRAELFDPGNRLVPVTMSTDTAGNIVVAGYRHPPSSNTAANSVLFLAQIDAAGVPVAAFGGDGIATHDLLPDTYELPDGVARTADGGVLVCDSGNFGAQEDAILVRYTPGGDIDTGYGADGIAYFDTSLPMQPNRHDYCKAVELQPGTGIAHIAVVSDPPPTKVLLVRVDGDGNTTTLNELITLDFNPFQPAALAFDPQGRALLMAPDIAANAMLGFVVARYNPAGLRDLTFGPSGVRRQEIPQPIGTDAATVRSLVGQIAVDARGRILVAAELEQTSSNFGGWSAMRMQGDTPFSDGFED